MSRAIVRTAVAARLAAVWPWSEIQYENGNPVPPADGSPYLVVEYPFATEDPASLGAPGANRQMAIGAVRFVLMMPAGIGTSPWDARLDDLAAAFRNFHSGDLRFFEADPPILGPRSDNGNWAEFSFAVAYRYDLFG